MRFFRKIQILIFEKVEFFFSERTGAIFAQGANTSVAKDFQKKNHFFLNIRFFELFKILQILFFIDLNR